MSAFSFATTQGAVVLVVVAVVIGAAVYAYRRHKAEEASLERLLARHPGWTRVNAPCGLVGRELAGRAAATPRGDRRYGVRRGIGGPMPLDVAGQQTVCDASFFEWFSEERRTSTDSNGNRSTSYRKVYETVGIARLPMRSPTVRIGAESFFGRMGLTRGGEQVESAEFNRRFRVEGADRTLTVQLLDANLQQVLMEQFSGRSIDVDGDLLVLGGSPDHRDESLTGVVREFPAVRQDLERLVRQVPPQFWRAIGADRPPPSAPSAEADRLDPASPPPPPPPPPGGPSTGRGA